MDIFQKIQKKLTKKVLIENIILKEVESKLRSDQESNMIQHVYVNNTGINRNIKFKF